MLLISSTIKSVFRNVFLLMMIIEFLLLVGILFFYNDSTIFLSKELIKSRTNITLKYNNLFKTYLERKYRLLIDDMSLFMQAYDTLQDNRYYGNNSVFIGNNFNQSKLNNCTICGSDNSILNINDNSDEWFAKQNDKKYIERRLKSTWFYNKTDDYSKLSVENKNRLVDLCILNDYLKNIILKQIRWMSFLYGTVNYISLSYSDSFFVKYPMFYNRYMQENAWTSLPDPGCDNKFNDIHIYNPKCRPFYMQVINSTSNIVLVKPYKFASNNLIGIEICIKSIKTNEKIPILVMCVATNFNDFQLYRDQISGSLGKDKRLFIIYNDENLNETNVMMNTEYGPNSYTSYGQLLNCTQSSKENSLFEVYNKKLFDIYYQSNTNSTFNPALNNKPGANSSEITRKYSETYNFYKDYIESEVVKKINLFRNLEKQKYDLSKLETDNNTFQFRVNNSFTYDDLTKDISQSDTLIQDFYLLPIDISFDYKEKYQIIRNPITQFYMLLMIERKTEYEKVELFRTIIFYETFLNFFFLIGVNLFIWVFIAMFYYFFSKGFFFPLTEINHIYKSLFLMSSENETRNSNDPYNIKQIENIEKEEDDSNKNIFNFLESKLSILTSWVNKIFELDNYAEVKDCINTLKMLKIIRNFDKMCTNKMVLNYEMEKDYQIFNTVDALFYLMQNIADSNVVDTNMDYNVVIGLIQNNFIYMINSKKDVVEVENFFKEINIIIEQIMNKKYSRKNSHLRKVNYYRRHSKSSETEMNNSDFKENSFSPNTHMENEIDNSDNLKHISSAKMFMEAFTRMKENLQYRYCIFKMKNFESKFDNTEKPDEYIDLEYNSDDQDKEVENNLHKRKNSNGNISDNENLIRKENELFALEMKERRDIDEISDLINEFNKYFTITEKAHISGDCLKHIAAHITQSGLLFKINSESEGIRQCILAMEKMKNLRIKINNNGILAKFSFLCVSVLVFERILLLLSTLSEKFDQKKTQFYLYLNILDLGPVYDKNVRSNVLQKLLDHLNKKGLEYIQNPKYPTYNLFYNEEGFLNTKLVRHKVRALLNMSKIYAKNILILCDLNLIFLKEPNFQNIIYNSVMKSKHFYYFACFDQKLYINRNIQIQEGQYAVNREHKIADENFFVNFSFEDQEIINLFRKKDSNDEESSYKVTVEPDYNDYACFFNFINTHKKINNVFTQNLYSRVDISIKNAIKHHKFQEYPKNNNFIIALTTIDSGFSFERENRLQISQALYDSQYSLIVCIVYDAKIAKDEKYRNKLLCYKKFIESDIINGHVFLLKSFSVLKYVLNCVIPNKFKEFEISTMKTFMDSVDLNFCEEIEENEEDGLTKPNEFINNDSGIES